MAVKYRLGCPVYTTAGKCTACPKFSDVYGDHAISKVSALLAITTSGTPSTIPVQVLPWFQPRRAELYYLGLMPGQQMSSCPIGPVGRTLRGM